MLFSVIHRERLASIALFVIIGVFGQAQTLTGVVYYHNEGLTANSVGEVHIVSRDGEHELGYEKPLRPVLSARCKEVGAVWQVTVDQQDSEWISRVRCAGEIDDRVHSIWDAVRTYLARMVADPLGSSTELSTRRWRESHDFALYLKNAIDLNLHIYLLSGDGQCLEVVQTVSSVRGQVKAGPDCHLQINGRPVDFVFNLVLNPEVHKWEVDGVEIGGLKRQDSQP